MTDRRRYRRSHFQIPCCWQELGTRGSYRVLRPRTDATRLSSFVCSHPCRNSCWIKSRLGDKFLPPAGAHRFMFAFQSVWPRRNLFLNARINLNKTHNKRDSTARRRTLSSVTLRRPSHMESKSTFEQSEATPVSFRKKTANKSCRASSHR